MKDVARFIAAYTKQYGAGAYGAPFAAELEQNPDSVIVIGDEGHKTVLIHKKLTRHSIRTDYTGRRFAIPAYAHVVTHIARDPSAPVPDLSSYDYLHSYIEDEALTAALFAQGRDIIAMKVSASSELVAIWGRKGEGHRYSAADQATFTRLDMDIPHADMVAEVEGISQWHDDFPYYSDGSWSAVSLRGYRPDDPTWGVKPTEMPKKWLLEHPEAAYLTCDWTTLSSRTPVIKKWVESVDWWPGLERVRLFRMVSKPGLDGHLGRHSDIQDKAAGTRNGQLARFHIPLITHPDIKMSCWALNGKRIEHHLAPGSMYYLDTRKPHCVDNRSPVDRVHLVVDVVVDERVRDRIATSTPVA